MATSSFIITLSVPPDAAKRLYQVQACTVRSFRAHEAGRYRRARSHKRQANKVWRKWAKRVTLVPYSAMNAPEPLHIEPSYDA